MTWYAYALLAAVGISLLSLIQKRVLREEHSLEYAMLFSVMKVFIFLPLFWSQIRWGITPSQFWLLVGGAALGSTAFLLIVKAIKRLEISTVTPLLALEPGLVTLLAVPLLRETIGSMALLGLVFMLVGTYYLELQHEQTGWWQQAAGSRWRLFQPLTSILKRDGGWYALLGLLAFTVSALFARRVLVQIPTTTYLAYDFTLVAVIYLFIFFGQRRRIQIMHRGHGHIWFFIFVLAVLHISQSAAQATAMRLAPIGLVITVKRISVLVDVTIGGRLFHEHRLKQKLLAAMMMVLGAYLIVVS